MRRLRMAIMIWTIVVVFFGPLFLFGCNEHVPQYCACPYKTYPNQVKAAVIKVTRK